MAIIKAIKLIEPLDYLYNNMVRKSYDYQGTNYLPLNLENELLEKDIKYEIVNYTVEEEEEIIVGDFPE